MVQLRCGREGDDGTEETERLFALVYALDIAGEGTGVGPASHA
jgi:hypothetical protein